MMEFASGALVTAIVWGLVSSLWQNTLLGLGALWLLSCMARTAARARYVAACGCLTLMIAAPVSTAVRTYRSAVVVPAQTEQAAPRAVPGDGLASESRTVLLPVAEQEPERIEGGAFTYLPQWVRGLVILLWLAGVLIHLLRLGALLHQTYRIAGFMTVAPPEWLSVIAREVASRMQVRAAACRVSVRAAVPMVIGIVRPTVIIPASLLTGVSPDVLRMLLAHELAHVRRHDFLFNLVQMIAESLLFYHPATWWLARRIRDEREHCCDDAAAAALGSRRALAVALVAAEELRSHQQATSLALASTGGALHERITRLLSVGQNERTLNPAALAAIPLLLAVIGLPATAVRSSAQTEEPGWQQVWSGAVPPDAWLRVYNLNGPVTVERRATVRTVVLARHTGADAVIDAASRAGSGDVSICVMQPEHGRCNEEGLIWRGSEEQLASGITELRVIMPLTTAVEAAAHAGDIVVSGGTADVTARNGAGAIDVATTAGDVEAASGSGGIRIQGARDVHVRSSNGDVELREVSGSARVRTTNGGLRATLARGAPDRVLDVRLGNGSGTVYLPREEYRLLSREQPGSRLIADRGDIRLIPRN